jgi:small subunit ribosomal protein S16
MMTRRYKYMLAIRLQRLGRKGLPHYRLIAQDSRFSPTSGRVVEYLGSYNPHSKELLIDKAAVQKRLDNGAQPSPRIAAMLKKEGIKLPEWVQVAPTKSRSIKNMDKLRVNRPKEETPEATEEFPAEPEAAEAPVAEAAAPASDAEATETPAE